MRKMLVIIIILAGCGDVSTPAAPAGPGSPIESGPLTPVELDLPCDGLAQTEQGSIYWYAEVDAPLEVDRVELCERDNIDFLDPHCTETLDYAVNEDGVLRVLCGTWTGTPANVADFVHVEGRDVETSR